MSTNNNDNKMYTTIAMVCSAYGEYIIVNAALIAKCPNTIGK